MHTIGTKKFNFFDFSCFAISVFLVKKKRVFPHYFFFTFFHFSKKKIEFFFNFFLIFLRSFCIKFHILKSQIMYLLYFFIYYHFNIQYYTLFLLFQNSLFSQYKKWKIEKIEFFCAYCVHIKKNLGDYSLMLCCSPKNFSWFFETFLVLKFLAKKNIFRKKGSTTEISKKKKKKKMKKWPIFADRPGYGSYIWGAHFCVLEGSSAQILHDLIFKCVPCASKVPFDYFVLARYQWLKFIDLSKKIIAC